MKKVLLINTGGTIAMTTDSSRNSVSLQGGSALQLLPAQPLADVHLTADDFLQLPSPHITPAVMLQLQQRVNKALKEDAYDGIVITHGTDTLEETAYFLDLTLNISVPVVITGAMRSQNEPGSDGPANLQAAILVAIHPASRDKGVLVVFNEQIHASREVRKVHTSNVAAFASPETGPIGTISNKQVTYHRLPLRRQHLPVTELNRCNVPLVKVVAGMEPAWLSALLAQGIDGLVIEAFGIGNVPPAIVTVLSELITSDIPVVLVTRCWQGQVHDLYDYPGGGKQLRQLGVIFASDESGPQARLKLMVALQQTRQLEQLRKLFET